MHVYARGCQEYTESIKFTTAQLLEHLSGLVVI